MILSKINDVNMVVSCSIYYYPFDEILRKVIQPFLKNHKIESFFFVKYFEDGPHIRLRMKLKGRENENIYSKMKSFFEEFLKNNASDIHLYEKNFKERFNSDWKIDAIEKTIYKPEIERYGGSIETMELCENQFQISSKNILSFLSENNGITYSHKLGYALKLNIGFVKAAWLSLPKTIIFYEMFTKESLFFAIGKENMQKDALDKKLVQMKSQYKKSENNIDDMLSRLWEDLEESSWIESNSIFFNQINNYIEKEGPSNIANDYSISIEKQKDFNLFNIYTSVVHMTHNRLGLFSYDEAYITFLIWQYFKKMLSVENQIATSQI